MGNRIDIDDVESSIKVGAFSLPWTNHPKYKKRREELINRFKKESRLASFTRLPKVIFICGKRDSSKRTKIVKYFKKHNPNYIFFNAEDAWDIIKETPPKLNALKLEEKLATFADAILIIVESFGSVAELGAFAISEKLRLKLIVIINEKYQKADSFISIGPINWVDNESMFGKTMYENFNNILHSCECLDTKLRKRGSIKQRKIIRQNSLIYENMTGKDLLFFIIELISIFEYTTFENLSYCMEKILSIKDKELISTILSLAVAIKYVHKIPIKNKESDVLFYCNITTLEGLLSTVTYNKLIREKIILLSSLQNIDSYKNIKSKFRSNNAIK